MQGFTCSMKWHQSLYDVADSGVAVAVAFVVDGGVAVVVAFVVAAVVGVGFTFKDVQPDECKKCTME